MGFSCCLSSNNHPFAGYLLKSITSSFVLNRANREYTMGWSPVQLRAHTHHLVLNLHLGAITVFNWPKHPCSWTVAEHANWDTQTTSLLCRPLLETCWQCRYNLCHPPTGIKISCQWRNTTWLTPTWSLTWTSILLCFNYKDPPLQFWKILPFFVGFSTTEQRSVSSVRHTPETSNPATSR